MALSLEDVRHLPPEEKVRPFSEMSALIRSLIKVGADVHVAQGGFDWFHVGHLGYLRAARRLCSASGIVIVGVENDEVLRLNKTAQRPINPAADRADILSELVSVDLAFIYEDVPRYDHPEDFMDRYRELCPTSVVVPTWDPNLTLKQAQAEASGTQLALVDYRHENSTTLLLRRIGFQE